MLLSSLAAAAVTHEACTAAAHRGLGAVLGWKVAAHNCAVVVLCRADSSDK